MGKGFGFNLPTRIEFEAGLISKAGKLVRELTAGKRAFIVTDPGVKEAGISEQVIDSLRSEGFECFVFDRVKPNPRDRDCEAGAEEAVLKGAEIIVAVGGGSVIDSAKVIALMQTHGGPLGLYEGRGRVKGAVTPVAAVPTTAGTGSEVTRSAVITDSGRKYKMSVKDVFLAPKMALVDPETTYTLPPGLTASTGMDALVHALEAYTCRLANPFSDALALAAMEKLYPALPVAVKDGLNKKAREDLMIGSVLAGIAFSHADVGAVHCMAEAIGGLYDIPHGVANSIFLPVVTEYNAAADPERHSRAAAACGLAAAPMKADEAARLLTENLAELSAQVNIPRLDSFKEVDPADFPRLAETAETNGSTPSNCRPITKKEYLELFYKCYEH